MPAPQYLPDLTLLIMLQQTSQLSASPPNLPPSSPKSLQMTFLTFGDLVISHCMMVDQVGQDEKCFHLSCVW